MAAVADVQTVNITINDIPMVVPKGELVVESIKRMGIDVPIFCYHPRMKPVGMCRMCLIEIGTKGPDGSVRMMPKPQTACSLPASEGLVIYTDSAKIHNDRRGVLEFLLVNHPLDCPICDRGGECPLQNNTLFYGPSTSRFVEAKRHAPKAFPLSKYVTLDLERCIQCGRCVRFTEEISGDAQLAFRFRGASMQPSTFELRDFTSKFSGNVIEICPVGALTNKEYRFRARPWDLQTRPAICTECGNGCNVWFDYRNDKMVRINGRTNDEVNEEWTCDRGKFGHEFYNSSDRLTDVLVRSGSQLSRSSWPDAYRLIAEAFGGTGTGSALIGGSRNSNEDVFLLAKLFKDTFKSPNLDFRTSELLPNPKPVKAPHTIASFENRKSILLFGTSLADEQPILYLRVRKAWVQRGAKIVVAHHSATDADGFAEVALRYRPGTGSILAAGLALALGVAGADPTFTPKYVEKESGVSPELLAAAAAVLKDSDPAVVTTNNIYDASDGLEIEKALASIGSEYDNYGLTANATGAAVLGLTPGTNGKNTKQILQGCIDGSIKALWLVGIDLFAEFPDQALVKVALESVEFLVVQDVILTESASYASVVLPMAAPAESDATWTNIEGRVQRFQTVLPAKGSAKAAWLAAGELAARMNGSFVPFNARDVMKIIASEVPAFAKVQYDTLPPEGLLLDL
ncbi:MAG TPA: NADH-quinone oxidoreductase subunit NuoG [Fimbriimonas sp.]|nr:NADH-quinone oxidoreductase subunit NuoG [Fimbriimonas sp.]